MPKAPDTILNDVLKLGRSTEADKVLEFNRNAANNPKLRWNESLMTLEFTNDGINYSPLPTTGSIGPVLTPNVTTANYEVVSGNSLYWPYLTVDTGDEVTVQNGAQIIGVEHITVLGTLTIESGGEGRIL